MSQIADFLRARYAEARTREESKWCVIRSPFDGHEVEIRCEFDNSQTLLVDGHPYPMEEWRNIATEPAPDPDVIADLDAKLALVDLMDGMLEAAEGDSEVDHYGALSAAEEALCILAQPFGGHPDRKGE